MKAFKVSLVVFVWLLNSSFSFVPYDWKDQKIQFKLPDFFMTETANDLAFHAVGNEMNFQLNVYMEELIDEGQINSFVTKMGSEKYGLSQIDGGAEIVGKGFKGYFINGIVDGELVYVLGLLDNDSGISYYGMIKYEDAEKANRIFANNIIKSFEKYF